MIEFNDLLVKEGIDPSSVVAMRHRPTDVLLRKALRRLALEDEQSFIDYQSSHGPRTEAAVKRAQFIASFIADGNGRALFVGLYEIVGSEVVYGRRWLENPNLRALVDTENRRREDRTDVVWFHQNRVLSFYADWAGCLCVGWPPPERSWYRWAHRNCLPILAIHDEQQLVPRLAEWDQLVFSWSELATLPRRHSDLLESWRGIYLIKDHSDGLCYVGSAYGSDNLLGRWQSYGRSGHGGNLLLRGRPPENFHFSILERLAETADPRDVIRRENSWKLRLGTRSPLGLNAN